ncbi:TPA: winged helix-turn-helix domain-containing protein [Serratia fonticola]|uniref:winged helix-turn-helix domain-containing protein n=1 Tax=Serratia fonticola TaxID=47917 RepID=UPI00217A575E|nr:helix-turn-helix domain-containing protein [Serratia fonticola]CAI1543984.1 Transcriptional regulatory protein, C terminal [Serratia fonticola]CAI1732214.1 Transcriptional regulatory protein, C terminal [Serratia fonticola]CAI1995187.1 Transcriptional regulatory protein, C terminal [Serratia fonticola]CAI2002901.1 Transcriptional regulatory protein, C terminal [Serratia fonticola]
MECIINGIVKYNSDDGTLLSPDNAIDMIKLTRVVNELLLLLINNNRSLLSRETLLRELWEERGLNASGNNLSNYVSILRKTLAKCGCPGLITTVPKHGFLFEADITLLVKTQKQRPAPALAEPQPTLVLPAPSVVAEHQPVTCAWLKGKMAPLVGVIMLVALLILPSVYDQWSMKSLRTEVFTLEQCKFYLSDDVTRGLDQASIITNLKMIVSNEQLNCLQKANVYYFAEKKRDASGNMIVNDLLTYCPYEGKASCDNYFMSKYENENEN